ncbi:HlyD family secretion protein [Oricola indica]|jgi:membrane fusion protein (multidrug efflux system)|uniref:HlyD family secretion protein n=1 Tax=Oricola indica TaxID=2872591 RepID=UPI001CC1302B|nr:HlyD family secretion protein [Oricola indica]
MNAITKTEEKTAEATSDAWDRQDAETKTKRKTGRNALMLALPVALVAIGGYVWVTGGRYQETENAYLQQPKVSISAEASGRVVETHVTDNGAVKKGDVLFVIDPEPYRIALEQAEASLAAARLSVGQLRATYSQAVTKQKAAQNDVDYYQAELDRQNTLATKGIATKAALDETRRNLTAAQDALASANEAVFGALAALGGDADIATDDHPTVKAAQAAREKAAYSLKQTTVTAPADGVLAQASSFQAGQLVSAGTALFSLVENDRSWVEANFKETQLTHMKAGQVAEITFDTFPGQPIKATVESIGAGTGSEFTLIPAQNATGNWVKVSQRIPVRLTVEDAGMALRTGMSATVAVDTGKSRGLPDFFGTSTAKAAE